MNMHYKKEYAEPLRNGVKLHTIRKRKVSVGLTYATYKALKEKHPNKLLIFVSHAEGMNPEGRAAKKVAYDADVKIFVQGFRAICKGRFITAPGNYYTIWEEGAAKYYANK